MSIEVTYEEDRATFATRPEYGKPVTFEVRFRSAVVGRSGWGGARKAGRYVVGLKGSDGNGFAHFTTFEAACRSALSRARRYERAFSKPRRTLVAA